MALRWSDIDFKKKTLDVNKTVTYVEKEKQILAPLKRHRVTAS